MSDKPTAPVPLTAYQKAWVLDESRFKIGVFSRQAGKSFMTSLEAVLDCAARKTKWVFLSAGERQSKELIGAATTHAQAIGAAARELVSDYRAGGDVYKQLEIVFSNGSRIVGLPANPDTARGHSANVLLDEFAFHRDSRAIWKALFPIVTRGFKIRIVSTFNGKQNMFYDLYQHAPVRKFFNGGVLEKEGETGWSKHFCDIHQALNLGLVLRDEDGNETTAEALREALNDDEAWSEEYLCIPQDGATAFLPFDLINQVEDEAAGHGDEYRGGPCFAGMDIGRRHDLTVIWVLELVGDVFWTREVVELKKAAFAIQDQELDRVVDLYRPVRVSIDQTGLGEKMVEDAKARHGRSRVEGILFTLAAKQELADGVKRAFEDRRVRIPSDRRIREDLHGVRRTRTAAGNFRFDAARGREGHSDRFWALALALEAGSGGGEVFEATRVKKRGLLDRTLRAVRTTAGFGRLRL